MSGRPQSESQGDLFQWAAHAPQTGCAANSVEDERSIARLDNPAFTSDGDLLRRLERCMDPGVTIAARVEVIRKTGERKLIDAIPALVHIVRLYSAMDAAKPAPEIAETVHALRVIGAPAVCAELGTLLLRGDYAAATWCAVLELHCALGAKAAPALLERAFARDEAALSAAAARLAGAGQHRRFRDVLRSLLDSLSAKTSAGAAVGLGMLGDRSVRAMLENELRKAEPPLDRDLVEALGVIGDRDAIVLIRRCLQRPWNDSEVEALLEAATSIGGPVADKLLVDAATMGRPQRA